MADYRQIHTSIWRDEWFLELAPEEKLLFIYLFSNASASLSGLYKLSLKVMAFDTRLNEDYIQDALNRFSQAGKVHYQDGVVWVVNMRRYHASPSPKIRSNIAKEVARIQDCALKRAYLEDTRYGIHTVSIPYGYHMDTVVGTENTVINLKESILKESILDTVSDDTVSAASGDAASPDEQMQHLAEYLTGILATPKDMPVLAEWSRLGVEEEDIRAALSWRATRNLPPIRSISQLNNGVKVSLAQRKQQGTDIDPHTLATEVYE